MDRKRPLAVQIKHGAGSSDSIDEMKRRMGEPGEKESGGIAWKIRSSRPSYPRPTKLRFYVFKFRCFKMLICLMKEHKRESAEADMSSELVQ